MTNTITLIPHRTYSCDILVAGGGVSGIAAAVAAARQGKSVILCESGGYLGGTATKGLVGPFMTCYDANGENNIIRGFFSELVSRMVSMNGAIPHEMCKGYDSYSGYRLKGHIGVTPFSVEALKQASEALCLESGVKLLYHMQIIGCKAENQRISSVYAAYPGGIAQINARQFIDATGNASLAAMAGAETFRGDENGLVQTASMFFRIDGVDKQTLDAYMAENTEMRARFFMDEIEQARREHRFPCGTRKLRIFEAPDGIWTVNMAQEDQLIDELNPEAVTAAEISQRKQIDEIIRFLRETIPGLQNIRLIDTAPEIGIRESRRIVGRTLLTKDDLLAGRHFEDAIAVCANSMDIHQSDRVNYTPYSGCNYTIPLSCLISKNITNLMAAGKCLSADKYAFAAVRVIPPCFAMGEAAGITAALAVDAGIDPHEVSSHTVQEIIIKNGGYLE